MAAVKESRASDEAPFAALIVPKSVQGLGNPDTTVPGDRPMSPFTTVPPVQVTVDIARTA
jgi:hypothetical protein